MPQEKFSQKDIIKQWRRDVNFINSDIRQFSLEPPSVFEECLESLRDTLECDPIESDLAIIEFILKRLENDAGKVLLDGGYPIDRAELCNMEEGVDYYWMNAEEGPRHYMGKPSMEALCAKQVLFSAYYIRIHVEKNELEKAVIETFKLMYAAVGAEMADTTWYGHRRKYMEENRTDSSTETKQEIKNRRIQKVFEIDDQIHAKYSRNAAANMILNKWDMEKDGTMTTRTIADYLKVAGRRTPKK